MPTGQLSIEALERLERVGGPELVARIVEFFLASTSERIRALENGLASNDLVTVGKVAHSLKSSAGNVGAERVRALADRIEQLAAAGETAALAEPVEQLGPAFESVAALLDERRRQEVDA